MSSGDRNVEELKRLVVHTLETNGVLGQIRAELRSNVYKVIDEDETRSTPARPPAAKLMNSPNGRLMAEIVAEFFEFYEFRHSLSVFMPESNLGRERRSRAEVAMEAGLDPRAARLADASILEQLVGLATSSAELRKGGDCRGEDWHSSASSTTASSPPPGAPTTAVRPHPNIDHSVSAKLNADLEASPRGGASVHALDKHSADSDIRSHPSSALASTGHGSSSVSATLPTPVAPIIAASGEEREEAVAGDEGAPEEASGSRRKPRRKQLLPLTGTKDFLGSSGGSQLPPLKASLSPASLSNASERPPTEEVSLGESSAGISRDSCDEVRDEVVRLDRRLARFPGRPTGPSPPAAPAGRDGATSPAGSSPTTGSPIGGAMAVGVTNLSGSVLSDVGERALEASANDVSAVSAGSQVSGAAGPARSLPRSAASSPANSSALAESPLRSPPLSPGSQHGASPASPASRSGADRSDVSVDQRSPRSGADQRSPAGSPAASPQSSGSAAHSADAQSVPEEAIEESMSVAESSGEGSLDIALGGAVGSGAANTASSGTAVGAMRGEGTLKRTPAAFPTSGGLQTVGPEDEVDEDIDDEDDSYHESYHSSSEANLSRGDGDNDF